MPLRIGYLSGSPRISTSDEAEVSGPRAHILGLLQALRMDGHTVDQYILGDHLGNVQSAGHSRYGFTMPGRQLGVDAVRLAGRPAAARAARRRLPGRYDFVYERYALFQQMGRGFQRHGAAWVVETNAVLAQEARLERNALALQKLASSLERRTYRDADLVVCVSGPLRDLLVTHAKVALEKLVVIPNAVDPERFDPAVAPAAKPRADLVVGYVGILVERQGLDDLIEVVASLRQGGAAISAVIVGDGPARRALESLVAQRNISGAVEFRGQVPWSEIPAHIASFDIAYSGQRGVAGMPMYHSPLKIYEYLAMGKPVVATDHADAKRALTEPCAGWLFDSGDRDALRQLLTSVYAMSRTELAAVGERARTHIVSAHTWSHRVDQLLGELRKRGLIG